MTADRDAMKRIFDEFFLARCAPSPGARTLFALKSRIETDAGDTTLEALSDLAGTSTRQVARLFRQHVGIGAKTFSAIARFQSALNQLKRNSTLSLADVAATCHYADQSHLVKDFKRYAGGVPRDFKGYYPADAPSDFSPNVVRFLQDAGPPSP